MSETKNRTTGQPGPKIAKKPTRQPTRYYSETESDEEEAPRRRRSQKGGPTGSLVPLGGLDGATNTATGLVNSAGQTLQGVTGSALSQDKEKGGSKSDTLRLRLDLNLDVEITLKARIHGDLELALLEIPKHSMISQRQHLKTLVSEKLPDVRVELAIYPRYETTGNLAICTAKFREWLEERAMELRKETSDAPWPPTDRSVGVVLVAHSMGGFVATDTLFSILNDQPASGEQESNPIFPLIQGILAFDTPYNGLARSMFVYGAFSQYQKVSNIWNIMSTVSAGLASGSAIASVSRTSNVLAKPAQPGPKKPAWKLWQTIAVRSGAAGAIAAGGVAAFMNREKIKKGIASFDRDTIGQGYNALGQGLAYINQESLGRGFAWISSHLKFVGALTKQEEMKQRLLRLGALEGVGLTNMYTSLGENGTWTGGYFVPERTFCAIPAVDEKANRIFLRQVNTVAGDEIDAHLAMFRPEKNDGYAKLSEDARDKIIGWFRSESPVVDPRYKIQHLEQKESQTEDYSDMENHPEVEDKVTENPDLSPLDLAAAAAAIPLPEDEAASSGYQSYLSRLGAKLSQAYPFDRSGATKEIATIPPTPPLDSEARSTTPDAGAGPSDPAAAAAEVPLPQDDVASSGYRAYISGISTKLSQVNPFNRPEAKNGNLTIPLAPTLDPEVRGENVAAIRPGNGSVATAESAGANTAVSNEKLEGDKEVEKTE
ncbi:hypothetical protein FGG08_005497 [Glutinoglossum americanum]|uniref:DUF676 domain-containing protein n=1 Tax=Glutinoglossum americanum TaxID=1670608 RepID=A0A9P8KYF7_9PEZI|nr:hypothetical protein FGG08_005497 [Glutinoglossum americanum]